MTQEQFSIDVTAYHRTIFRLAFNCLGSRSDAEDIVQDTFLKLYQYKKPFNDEEHKKAFLLRTASNLCKDLLKSAWFRRRTALDENIPADNDFSKSEEVLSEYILRLKHKYRCVIFLFYYEGYSVKEIAVILKMSETSVTTSLNRARNQLKKELSDNEEELIYEYVH